MKRTPGAETMEKFGTISRAELEHTSQGFLAMSKSLGRPIRMTCGEITILVTPDLDQATLVNRYIQCWNQQQAQAVTAIARDKDLYVGESLDQQVNPFGVVRLPDEDDWSLRRRSFPRVYGENRTVAMELLFGAPTEFLTEMEQALVLRAPASDPTFTQLEMFTRGFTEDPAIKREKG